METKENSYAKLDYSLKTAAERSNFVSQMDLTNISNNYNQILANYIVSAMTPEEKKAKEILTDNRMVTINKRETSYQGLVSKFENGEDGLWNITIDDKNVLLTHKLEITKKDVAEMPDLVPLREGIESLEGQVKRATGKRKYLLKKQLIEMHQEQYVIKGLQKPSIPSGSITKSLSKVSLPDDIYIDENGTPINRGLVDFFNPKHISALLCNYSALKQDAWGQFGGDLFYLMEDLDILVDKTLKDNFELYYWLVIYKIDGLQNIEVQEKLQDQFGTTYTVEYLSSLWRNKIPKMIAEKAQEDYLIWYYTTQEQGQWKTCSRCGETKLAHNKFFSKNGTSKDGFYSICKKCRNKKKEGE